MKGFTTADPLRRFVQVTIRWATIFRVKLDVDYLPGIDNEWVDALSRSEDSINSFLPPEQRIEFSVNDLPSPVHQPMRVRGGQLRKLEVMSAQRLAPHGF